jgi:ABC-type sugar transport system permease subunit
MTKNWLHIRRWLAVILVVALAWGLRARAVSLLGPDYDEDDYLRAGQEYAKLMRASDWDGFMDTNYRPEHPPFVKILIGASLLSAPEQPLIPDAATTAPPNATLPRDLLRPARLLNAIFGTLTVLLLAILNPLAGLFLAAHTFTIKYVSQVMLEAFPALTSLAMVLAYLQFRKRGGAGWLLVSSIFLGLTAASKYLYCIAAVAILTDWFLEARERDDLKRFYRQAALWAALAVAVFFAFNPYLWSDPLGRLRESVFYHAGYSTTAAEVQSADYPAWQVFTWLSFSPFWWHAGVFPFPFDLFITILALIGLKRLWNSERVYALWLGIAILFLLLWPTKWPQYVVMFTVPLSLAAAQGWMSLVVDPIRAWLATRMDGTRIRVPEHNDLRRALPWLVPGLIAFTILTLFPLLFQLGVSFTDFSVVSLRDGLQGGLWRAILGGFTDRLAAAPEIPFGSPTVDFIGPVIYLPVLGYLTGDGILTFNILWTVASVSLQVALGLGIALLLWQKGVRLGKFWQAFFILPWAIPEMIGAMMWWNVFQPDWGWLDLAVVKYGPNVPFGFLANWDTSTNLWLLVFLIPALWYGFPFMMLAASAGLKLIPIDVFDAAAIDGANGWQTFRHVTWPLLAPLLVPAIIVRGIFAFNQFYLFQAFFALEATLSTLSYNVFNSSGFHALGGQFALSAVINILNVVILIGFVTAFNRWSKAGEGVSYA